MVVSDSRFLLVTVALEPETLAHGWVFSLWLWLSLLSEDFRESYESIKSYELLQSHHENNYKVKLTFFRILTTSFGFFHLLSSPIAVSAEFTSEAGPVAIAAAIMRHPRTFKICRQIVISNKCAFVYVRCSSCKSRGTHSSRVFLSA